MSACCHAPFPFQNSYKPHSPFDLRLFTSINLLLCPIPVREKVIARAGELRGLIAGRGQGERDAVSRSG